KNIKCIQRKIVHMALLILRKVDAILRIDILISLPKENIPFFYMGSKIIKLFGFFWYIIIIIKRYPIIT
ncbi:MAG: hypothetical protein Q6363_009625, partial [Candidatus Njordarchaeota archaeon]